MARPVVLIYQEFAQVTVTPDTPDLNCLVVGPAYWIQDYLDDKASIQAASDYGTKDANNAYIAPAPATDAITIAEPPNNKTGALLDSTSVKVFFDEARVLIVEDADDADASTGVSVTADSNLVTATGGTPIDWVAAGVKAGDYLIIEDPAGGGTDLVKRVLAVDSTTVLRTTTNFTATQTTLLVRVEREVSDVEIDTAFVSITGNEVKILGGVTTVLTGEITARTVNYAKVYVQYRSLRQDLRLVDTVSSETDITTKIGRIDSRNPLAGVVAAALANTTTTIQFFGVKSDDSAGHDEALEVVQGRDDIYAMVPITQSATIIAKYKTEVEGLASVAIAETTGIPQKFRVVIGAQALPTEKVVSPTSGYYSAGAHNTIDGPIAGTPIASADPQSIFVDPNGTLLTAGVRANDTLVIVTDTAATDRSGSYTVAEVYDNQRLRITGVFPGTNKMQGDVQYYVIRGTGTPETTLPGSFADDGVTASTAPATVTTNIDRSLGVANEYAGKIYRAGGALSGDYLITASTAANPAVLTVAPATITTETNVSGSFVNTIVSVTVAQQATTRRPFRLIRDNNATLITDLVIATDNLQIPNPVTGVNFTTVFEHAVAYVPNENDLILATNEDAEAQDPELGDTTLAFRVGRNLTKDDQVDELVAIAQSFKSRRVILVWPDEVTVADLVDGSKTRTVATTPEAADAQPGYYLAGVVGGLTAGLPSHQGFTNLGIAGVSEIGHSTRYFSDTQLTELSDGGWFVFGQATPSSLPFSIHQLTTDPSTLESGEYSVVKNFDFVSLFFQDILDDFLGIYNINEETIGFLRQSLNTGIDLLKLRKFAKIGAPLNDASLTSVTESTASADRVEAYMSVDLPKPLNRIGLHLISA